jgi:hypothetical protein
MPLLGPLAVRQVVAAAATMEAPLPPSAWEVVSQGVGEEKEGRGVGQEQQGLLQLGVQEGAGAAEEWVVRR